MALISVSNNALSNITALPASIPTGALTLIKSITASASASIEFINGTNGVVLDGTYSSYVFKFINIHPSTTGQFEFQGSTNGGSSYGVTATTTIFRAYHGENDAYGSLGYYDVDLAQSTAFQRLAYIDPTSGNDINASGYLQLFNLSSTTYVKHFLARNNFMYEAGTTVSQEDYVGGYFNTTSAVNAIRFQMSAGNIDDGTIKLYGVS